MPYVIIIAVILWCGVCAFALMLALFLIKPLFSFVRSKEADGCVEVFREDCPQLFDIIDDIVRFTGNRKPKHVYLSDDVNACVFFNSSFWSIFFPVRKNLKIGLGLFDGLSVDELKSVLAHEFGHFSQKSMKVGSTVYVVNQILYNMTYSEDLWDELLNNWCSSSYWLWAFMGIVTRLFTNWIKRINISMYRFVARGYRKLSRQMEYDADNVACSYVGSEAFVSGLCKTEVNSTQREYFNTAISQLLNDKKKVDNIFEAYAIILGELPDGYQGKLNYAVPLTEPHNRMNVKSRVNVEGTWDSHPELSARIQNAHTHPASASGGNHSVEAWTLIPEEVRNLVSETFFEKVIDPDVKYETISAGELKTWAAGFFKDNLYDPLLQPFVGRKIVQFDVDKELEDLSPVSNPFNEGNRAILAQFLTAGSDWALLNEVESGEREVDRLEYDGKEVPRKSLPSVIAAHKEYYQQLLKRVAAIDKSVFSFLVQKAEDEKARTDVIQSYRMLFHVDHIINSTINDIFGARNYIDQKLRAVASSAFRSEDDVYNLKLEVTRYVEYLQQRIGELDLRTLSLVADDEFIRSIEKARDMKDIYSYALSDEMLNTMVINVPQSLLRAFQALQGLAKTHICNNAEPFALNAVDEAEQEQTAQEQTEDAGQIRIADWVSPRRHANSGIHVFFVIGFSILMVVLFAMRNGGPKEQSVNVPDYEPVQYVSNYQPTVGDGEMTDGIIVVKLPQGMKGNRVGGNDGIASLDLFDDKDNPSYSIKLFSGMESDYDADKFERLWENMKDESSEMETNASYGDTQTTMNGSRHVFTKTTIYHGDHDVCWKFIVIYDAFNGKTAVLSCWGHSELAIPSDELINSIDTRR